MLDINVHNDQECTGNEPALLSSVGGLKSALTARSRDCSLTGTMGNILAENLMVLSLARIS